MPYANATVAAMPDLPSRDGPLIGLQVFLISLALIMCALRIYSRLLVVHSLGFDDYLMVGSAVSNQILIPLILHPVLIRVTTVCISAFSD